MLQILGRLYLDVFLVWSTEPFKNPYSGLHLVDRKLPKLEMSDKSKVGLKIRSDVLNDARDTFPIDQCRCLSEFTERALEYYMGYVRSNRMADYLSPTIMSSLKAVSDESTTRITRILFKLAVEMAVMNNLFAASLNIDEEQINSIRNECEKAVRRTNGNFNMNDAVRWQKGG